MFLLLAAYLALQAQPNQPAPAERDVVDVARSLLKRPPAIDEGTDERRVIVPTIGSAPGSGTSFGVLMTRQERDEHGALSLRYIGASYSTAHRLQISARFDEPLSARWQLIGDWRFYDFTERTYGLGTETTSETFRDIALAWARGHMTLYRKLGRGFAVGSGYQIDARQIDDFGGTFEDVPDRQTIASGISFDALFDTRDNPTNASRGWLGRASVAWFPEALGTDRDWESVELEARTYVRLPTRRRQILAAWSLLWLTAGEPTYFDLPSTAGDMYGRTTRGYAVGRFRGRDWMDVEAEYRVDVLESGLLGAVGFVNTSTFSDVGGRFGPWVTGGGAGLRIKFDKRHASNLCVDYAWGVDGSRGLFLSLNEAF